MTKLAFATVENIYLIILLLLVNLVFLNIPAYGDIYSWKDKSGVTHFGDKKLGSVKQAKVELKVKSSMWKEYIIDINDIDNVLTDKEILQIRKDVNAVYNFFDNKLHFDIFKTVPVKIRLYEKQENYQRFISSKMAYINYHKKTRGMYFPRTNEIIVLLNKKERWRTFWTIKHETSHAIVDTLTPFIPSWFNEGIAENMEVLKSDGQDLVLLPHSENYLSVMRDYNKGNNIGVEKLLSISSRAFYTKQVCGRSSNHSCVGEFVRMLLSTRHGKSFVTRIIHIYKGGSRIYSSTLVDMHYVGGLFRLKYNWNNWVARSTNEVLKL